MSNGNQSAFPLSAGYQSGDEVTYGLTKREYIATQIMAGFAADQNVPLTTPDEGQCAEVISGLAQGAVAWADALLAELAK